MFTPKSVILTGLTTSLDQQRLVRISLRGIITSRSSGIPTIQSCSEWDGEGEVLEFSCDARTLDPAKRYIVNVGSVGEPRDPDDLSARYVIYDTVSRQVEFRSVAFDIPALSG